MNEIEIAPPSVVEQAVSDFASALAETLQFKAFEQADYRLRQDSVAQQSLAAYKQKWKSLEALIRLNALNAEDREELERLRQNYLTLPAVLDYVLAQAELVPLCQSAGNTISSATGLNFSAACGSGCCG